MHVQPRDPENDEFLVIACDGIWDVMSNEDCGAYIKREVEAGNPTLVDVRRVSRCFGCAVTSPFPLPSLCACNVVSPVCLSSCHVWRGGATMQLCNAVIMECLRLGSRDNMSVIIVAFPAAPTPSP
jgi:serine/threonine protein phosphatase PrpC